MFGNVCVLPGSAVVRTCMQSVCFCRRSPLPSLLTCGTAAISITGFHPFRSAGRDNVPLSLDVPA
jgi:hypothetical protein